jgi:2-polyprenyl-3-methyl-5-hydroxy-6-metoxy-1,4-benzoquinol methylase
MDSQKTSELYDLQVSRDFYEERYDHGYMDEWSVEKKQRVFEVIRSLGLPEKGDALDFGCGNGVLTEVIKQALPPAWNVYGTDLSTIAVENAQERCPSCTFFFAEDKETKSVPRQYDFLFTHHVLEHVYDIDPMIDIIDNYLKDKAAMLHVLPCGNADSFERGVCLLRKDGIDAKLQNRFFYEDEGHVRRLTGSTRFLFFSAGI